MDSIISVLQDNARGFREFQGEDGKIVKSLKCAVHVLYALSTSTALGEGIGLVSHFVVYHSYVFHIHSHLQRQFLLLSQSCLVYVSFTILIRVSS